VKFEAAKNDGTNQQKNKSLKKQMDEKNDTGNLSVSGDKIMASAQTSS